MIISRNRAFFLIFKSNFWSAAEFWAVVADIIVRVLNRPGTVLAVVLHISKAFESFSLLDKHKCYRISDRVFGLVLSFFSVFCYQNLLYRYVRSFVILYLCFIDVCLCGCKCSCNNIHNVAKKVASDINIYWNYFLQYFESNFSGPSLWYWSSSGSFFRHYHFSNNYRCLYI